MQGLSRAVFLSVLLGLGACGEKVDPEAEAAKLKSDLAEADARLKNHKIEDAERIYLRVLEKHPNQPEAEFGMAKVRFVENNLTDAEVLLKRVVTALPDNPKVHAKLAHVYHLTERFSEAATHYGKAFEIEPDNGDYGLAYGIDLKKAQSYPEAERVLRQVSEIDPMVRFVWTELADVVRAQNRLPEALKIYMKAQNTYASDKMARAGAALVYEAQGDNARALDEWSGYIRMDCCSPYSNDVAKKKIENLRVQFPDGVTHVDSVDAIPAQDTEGAAPADGAVAADEPPAEGAPAAPAAPAPAPAEQPAAG